MADFYTDMQNVATDILGQFKQGVVNYVQITKGNGPVDNPGAATLVRFPIAGAVNGVGFKYIGQNGVVGTDRQVIAAVDARYEPNMKDSVEVDGLMHKIVQIVKKPEAGTTVARLLIIRRGT